MLEGEATNSELTALRAAVGLSGTTALELLHLKYRSTKQPGKKVIGIYRCLRRMAKRGLLREVTGDHYFNNRFIITPTGRQVLADGPWYDRTHTFPRLAT